MCLPGRRCRPGIKLIKIYLSNKKLKISKAAAVLIWQLKEEQQKSQFHKHTQERKRIFISDSEINKNGK